MEKRTSQIAGSVDAGAGTGLTYELIDVAIPFEQRYIPYRHRNTETNNLRRSQAVAILTFEAGQAPVSHRIHPMVDDRLPPVEIVRYAGRYWWPLLDGHHPVARERFVAPAEGSYGVLTKCSTLGHIPGIGARRWRFFTRKRLNAGWSGPPSMPRELARSAARTGSRSARIGF